jgi:hypothetical protein
MDRPMKSKSERAGELLAQLIDLVHQAAENPAALADLEQTARNLGDRLVELFQESDDQANGTC